MKKIVYMLALPFASVLIWKIGSDLSSDAIAMALGIFFGVLAGIPPALLVLAAQRPRQLTIVNRDERSVDVHLPQIPAPRRIELVPTRPRMTMKRWREISAQLGGIEAHLERANRPRISGFGPALEDWEE